MGKILFGAACGFIAAGIVKCVKQNTVIEKELADDGSTFRFKMTFNSKKKPA